ncbi:MAG: nucleotide sugar dehydrogenase [Oleibacter sp.]|nr:nucleotide sugar dehydrogenase [Thalassolituus sp.]
MKVFVIGCNYAALVTSACFAEMGNLVTHYHADETQYKQLTAMPEPGLQPMVASNVAAGRLSFSDQFEAAVKQSDVIIIAYRDISAGRPDLFNLADRIVAAAERDLVVINKSPVHVGGGDELIQFISQAVALRNVDFIIDLVANPDFLREGGAINDFMHPDRIIIGSDSYNARAKMTELFSPFTRQQDKLVYMGIRDAEMARFATNIMLAARVSLMNELAVIAEKMGVDIENVRRGLGADSRIGYSYLYPGVGYGGAHLQHDVCTIAENAKQHGLDPVVLNAITERNHQQGIWAYNQLADLFGDLKGCHIGIWGLSFRPGTASVEGAPAIVLIGQLMDAGAVVTAYDPMAMDLLPKQLPPEWFERGQLSLCDHQYEAVADADALVLMTEWKPFRQPDFNAMAKLLNKKIIIDGRNQYDPQSLKASGYIYRGVGRSSN